MKIRCVNENKLKKKKEMKNEQNEGNIFKLRG